MNKIYSKSLLSKYLLFFIPIFLVHTVLAQPRINSFSPLSGPVGTKVIITGANFSAVAANNIVYFGTVKATVSTASASSLSVIVPTGTAYQPITVTTGNLTAYSNRPFTVTFSGGGPSFATDSFSAPKYTGTTMGSNGTLIGDLDGDGKPDIVSLNVNNPYFSVYQNATSGPSGTFYFGNQYTFGIGGSSVGCLADLDGDGRLDLVMTASSPASVYLYKNTSSGSSISFLGIGAYSTGAATVSNNSGMPLSIAVADLDGDGKPDIITANNDSTITVYSNTSNAGNISFANKQNFTISSIGKSVVIGDINGDGKPDIIVTCGTTGKISVFTNTSVSGAVSFAAKMDFAAGSSPSQLAIGDLDGDGKLDLAVTDVTLNKVILFRNTGTGGSISFSSDSSYYCGPNAPTGVAINDIDGDGKPDLAVSTTNLGLLNMNQQYSILAFKNASSPGMISFAPAIGYPAGYSLFSVALVDMNGDGKPDMIAADPAGRTFNVLLNKIQQIQVQTPHITLFTPTSAGQGATVNIHGTSLTGISSVRFGQVPAQSFTVFSDTMISAVVGTGTSGNVLVSGPNGIDSLAGFVYIPPAVAPDIVSFTPTSGGTGTTVRIYGTALTGVTAVSFGHVAAQSFTIVSDSLINAVVGAGASGQVWVGGTNSVDSLAGFIFADSTVAVNPGTAVFRLVQFTGTSTANQPVLKWQVINDQSIAYYVVAHSTDSVHFTAVDSVKAAGEDSTIYSFIDPASRTGINYYQLVIEDTAGHITYSSRVVIVMPGITATLSGRPNPAIGSITVVPPSVLKPATFKLVDMNGNVTRTIPVSPNVQQVKIDLSGLMTGIYKLVWSDGTNYSYQTILVLQ